MQRADLAVPGMPHSLPFLLLYLLLQPETLSTLYAAN